METIKHVKTGDSIQFKAETFNRFVDAANDYTRRSGNQFTGGVLSSVFDGSVIVAKNTGGQDVKPYTPVSIVEPFVDASLDAERAAKFKTRQAVKCQPISQATPGPAAVALDKIRAGKVGRIVASGAVFCQVDLQTIYDDVAIASSTAGQFKGATHGVCGARILTRPPGDKLGLNWCIVELGEVRARYASVYRCQLAADLLATDASVSVDTFIAYNGLKLPSYTGSQTQTAFNPFSLSGSDNAAALIQWSHDEQRWELTMVGCA